MLMPFFLLVRQLIKPVSLVLVGFIVCMVVSTAQASPRVASMNLCTDQLLMLLAEPEQISSLSHLSVEEGGSYFVELAARYPLNKGRTEDFLRLAPNVILAGNYTPKHSVSLLRKLGFTVEVVPAAQTIDDIYAAIRQVGNIVEQRRRAETIILHMQQGLRIVPAPPENRPRVAIYDPNGYTVGAKTLRGQLLEIAGWHNVAEDIGVTHYGTLPLEQLVAMTPDAYVDSPYAASAWSRAQELAKHPALQKLGMGQRIAIPSAMTICAGPWTVDVIETLVDARLELTP